jgi:fucose 4-O-acetylase-like acetyltransferase
LVLVGHLLIGTQSSNVLKNEIYLFHMPLFLAVSGFLLREIKIRDTSVKSLFRKYWNRMLLQWAIAMVVFFALIYYVGIRNDFVPIPVNLEILGEELIYPYNHLWYVPALFLMIIALHFILAWRIPRRLVIGASLLFSVAWLTLYMSPSGIDWIGPVLPNPAFLLGNKRVFYYFAFFFAGFCLRNYWGQVRHMIAIAALAGALFAISLFQFYAPSEQLLMALVFVCFNLVLLLVVLSYCMTTGTAKSTLLSNIGKNSISIYLWHPVIIFAAYALFFDPLGEMSYYVLTAVFLTAFVLLDLWLAPKLHSALRKLSFSSTE